jgi:hypothetical protein
MSDMFDFYLDDMLSTEQRRDFEAQLATTPELRDALAAQRRIDSRLRAMFEVGAAVGADEVVQQEQVQQKALHPLRPRSPRSVSRVWVRWGALAALFVLVGLVWTYTLGGLSGDPRALTLTALYKQELKGGFKPKEVCTDPAAFCEWMSRRYGQGLTVKDPPAGLTLVGWDYAELVSPYSAVLLAKVDGQEVVVVLDRLVVEKRAQPAGAQHGLNVFRGVVGKMVVYEVSPLPDARIINLLEEGSATRHCP